MAVLQGRAEKRLPGTRHRAALATPAGPFCGAGNGAGCSHQVELNLMTWNISNMISARSRELELRVLLEREIPDVAVLTEVELKEMDNSFFSQGTKCMPVCQSGGRSWS